MMKANDWMITKRYVIYKCVFENNDSRVLANILILFKIIE